MINARDLRIGNFINFLYPEEDAGGNMIGHSENRCINSGADIQHVADWPDSYNGIPLTEDWLIKCGFILRPYFAYNGLRLSLKFARYDSAEPFLQIDSPFGSTTLRYVHELQNWFWILNGQELEIKL